MTKLIPPRLRIENESHRSYPRRNDQGPLIYMEMKKEIFKLIVALFTFGKEMPMMQSSGIYLMS